MPTYDYKCNACSHTFEHFQSMKDAQLKKCPKCGKNKLRRLISDGNGARLGGDGRADPIPQHGRRPPLASEVREGLDRPPQLGWPIFRVVQGVVRRQGYAAAVAGTSGPPAVGGGCRVGP